MSEPGTRAVTSADGTRIEYLTVGHGPSAIVIPGALATARDLLPLAGLLGRRHAVHIVQRRGRGGSGPQGDRYGIERECEDIEAVRARTGARLLFGHSFGGLVALRAAGARPETGTAPPEGAADTGAAFDAVAVYDPGVSAAGSIPVDWVGRARRELRAGAAFDAFVTFARGVSPASTGRVPRWLLRIILRRMISRDQLRQYLALMPQAISEHIEVGRLDARLGDYRQVTAATLLMRGRGRDTGWQAVALARLAETIPDTRTMAFPGLDHFAPEKKPGAIADAILAHFAGDDGALV